MDRRAGEQVIPTISDFTREELRDLEAAARAWGKADESLWSFAPLAAAVVGRHIDGLTAELARRIGRSSDAVEGYASGYRLLVKLLERYPSQSEILRADLSIGHWIAVSKKWKSKWITLTDAANYLNMAVKENLSVEDLRRKLPSNDKTDSIRMMKGDIVRLDKKYLNAPRLNIPNNVIRAVKLLRGRLVKAVK